MSILKILRENQKQLKINKNKTFINQEQISSEVDEILKNAYTTNLLENFMNPNYVNLYKINQMLNSITPSLKYFQRSGSNSFAIEDIFNNKQRINWRMLTSIHFLTSEIQMMLEQNYVLQALGRLRLLLEEIIILDLLDKYDDLYIDALEFGNYHWGEFENFFHPKVTKETKEFDSYMEQKYTKKDLAKKSFWIEKNINRYYRATDEFVRIYKDNKIMMHAWNMSHNFNHAGAMLLALDDKPHLYNEMAKYAYPLILISIINTYKKILSKIIKMLDEDTRKKMYELEISPIIEMVEEINQFINSIAPVEDELLKFINEREKNI